MPAAAKLGAPRLIVRVGSRRDGGSARRNRRVARAGDDALSPKVRQRMLKPRRLVRLFLVFVASPGAATLVDGVPDAQIGPEQAFAALGSVAGAGDVNGDGYDDVIVGASSWNVGASAHPRPRTAKS